MEFNILRLILINIVDVNLQQMPSDTPHNIVNEATSKKVEPKQTNTDEKTIQKVPTKPLENTKTDSENKELEESKKDKIKISETSDENMESSDQSEILKTPENDNCIPSKDNKCNLLDQKSDSRDDNLNKNSVKAYAKSKRRDDMSNNSNSSNEDFSNKNNPKNNKSPLNVRIKSVNSNSYLSIHGDQLISRKNNGSVFKIENDLLGVLISTGSRNPSNRSQNRSERSFLCMKDKTVRFCSIREIKKNRNAYRDKLYEHWSLINNGSGFMISSGSKCLRQYYNSNNGSYAVKVDLCPSRNGMDTNFYFALEPLGGVNNMDTYDMYSPYNEYPTNKSGDYSDPNKSRGPSKNKRRRQMRGSRDDRNRYIDEGDHYREEEYQNRQGRGKHSYKKRPRRHSKSFSSYSSPDAYSNDLRRSTRRRKMRITQFPPVGCNNMERNRCLPNRSTPNTCNTMGNMQFPNPPIMNNMNQMNNICKPQIPCLPNMQSITPIPQYRYSRLLNEISDASNILNHSKLLKPVEMRGKYFRNYKTTTPLPIDENSPTTTFSNKVLDPLPRKNTFASNLIPSDIAKTANKIVIDCKGMSLIECQKINQQSLRS